MKRWSQRRLGDLADVLSGFAFDSEGFGDTGDLPLVRIRDVVPGESSTFYRGAFDPRYIVSTGDILIGMDGEFNRARWRGGRALLNQRVSKIAPSCPELDDGYLFHFLPAALKAIEQVTPFVTVKHLSVKQIRDIAVQLPPVPEQRRIAEILDKADALRAKRRAALAQLDTLIQSIFLDMFSGPDAHLWRMTTIADVAAGGKESIRTGPFGSQLLHSEFQDNGIAVLGIDNAIDNEFRWGERRFISEAKFRQLVRYTVKPGDVLITIMGTYGRCVIVPDDIPIAINTKHLCCITLDKAKCLPTFLHAYFLRHPIARQYLAKRAKGAIMDGLNMGIIKEMPIPLVPLSLQLAFTRSLNQVRRIVFNAKLSEVNLGVLFTSLQHRAFRGEL